LFGVEVIAFLEQTPSRKIGEKGFLERISRLVLMESMQHFQKSGRICAGATCRVRPEGVKAGGKGSVLLGWWRQLETVMQFRGGFIRCRVYKNACTSGLCFNEPFTCEAQQYIF